VERDKLADPTLQETHARVSAVVRNKSHVSHMHSHVLQDFDAIVPPEVLLLFIVLSDPERVVAAFFRFQEQCVIFEEQFLKYTLVLMFSRCSLSSHFSCLQ
jgi:hypothetical protein